MKAPKTLTIFQVHALLANLIVSDGTCKQFARGLRNYTMAMVMLETGLRVNELVQLEVSDLWFMDNPVETLIVRSDIAKGNKERQVPISAILKLALIEINKNAWSIHDMPRKPFAFYTNDQGDPLTTRQVERFIKSAGIIAFNQVVTPHMLRHTFASRLMRKTNSRIVQSLLGHASLQSTQVYCHPDAEDLKRAIDSPDPAA